VSYQYDSVSTSRLLSWYSMECLMGQSPPDTCLSGWRLLARRWCQCSADTAECVVRRTYNNFGDCMVLCTAASRTTSQWRLWFWNTLPLNLRLCDSLGQIKRSLETFLSGMWACETTGPCELWTCDTSLKRAAQKFSYLLTCLPFRFPLQVTFSIFSSRFFVWRFTA